MANKIAGLLFLATSLMMPVAAHADAGEFLKSLDGNYSGKGTATTGAGEKTQRVNCKISNSFSESKKALGIQGNCASAQGKRKVSGQITYSGNTVQGALLSGSRGYEVTKSSGSVEGNKLVISVSLMDKRVNKLVRGQQILEKTGSGFTSTVYRFDNKSQNFKSIGKMDFTKQ